MLLTSMPSEVLQEQDSKQELSNLRKAQMSKMKTLSAQLQALLQKKIRVELEIRNTRRKLSKLKTASRNNLKLSLELEGLDLSSGTIDSNLLLETVGPELHKELTSFDKVLDEVETVLASVESDLDNQKDKE